MPRLSDSSRSSPVEPLGLDELGDLLEQAGLVDLVRQLGDDDGLPPGLAVLLDFGARPHVNLSPARSVSTADTGAAVDDPGRGKIRPADLLHQLIDAGFLVVDQDDAGIDDLGQVVGRDIRGHAHRDAGRTVDQQVRKTGRQHQWLKLGFIIVGAEVHGFLVDVRQQLVRDLGQPDLRVAHGRRGISVHGAEVALAVYGRVAHGKMLRHAHDGVVDRDVAVGVVFTDDVADDAGRFLVRLVPVVARPWRRAPGDAPASGRPERRAAPCRRSRSWHTPDRIGASPDRDWTV